MRRTLFVLLALLAIAAASSDAIARNECARLVRSQGGEVLVNTCKACRMIGVERARPTGGVPNNRAYTMPERTKRPLPFRGPGRTRIVSDRPCAGGPSGTRLDETDARRCVEMRQASTGQPVLVNPCGTCRLVGLERADAAGNRRQSTHALAPKSIMPVDHRGVASVRVLGERPCG